MPNMLNDFYMGIIVIIILIGIGTLLTKVKIINDDAAKFLSNLILSVALPVAFFNSFPAEFSFDKLNLFLWGAACAVITLTILILISQLLFAKKIMKRANHEYKFAFAFNNTSFIGYPLVSMAYGPDGLVAYAGFMLPWVIALFTYGVSLFKDNYSWRDTLKVFTNPNIIGIISGALVFIFSFNLPIVVDRTVNLIAGITTPMALFCIGFMLFQTKIKGLFKRWQVVFVCLLQLIIPPLFTFFFLKLIGAPVVVVSVLTLMQMLPTAATLGLFAQKNDIKDSEAGEIVTLSTILAAITVPILIYLLIGSLG